MNPLNSLRSSLLVRAVLLAAACTAVPATLLALRAARLQAGELVRLPLVLPEGGGTALPLGYLTPDIVVEPAAGLTQPVDRAAPDPSSPAQDTAHWQTDGWIALRPGPDGLWQITRAQDVRFPAGPGEVLLRAGYGPAQDPDGLERAPEASGPAAPARPPEAFQLFLTDLDSIWIAPGVTLAEGPATLLVRVGRDARATFVGLEQDGKAVVTEGPL
jgi:hypothetical protein